ncbi:uncharacterized protein PV09_09034 [Verruconis gallopava]|uniref:Trafficking protein particle complex subunit 2-like protein n=1 Tax=Verruconis gallopava TaxID=253628 RepID=A0A0D1ZYU8_9PEZI|nr:uncharacterized protein PV09_09034 [Verruconis gallopava]KIV99264.1 hypothetical protein PV09_09034 [Verruconis gallopava]
MANRAPGIACIGFIGKANNPLHISLFPPKERDYLQYSFMLSSCLDLFELRMPHKTADQDFGLLQAIDERLAMYGWLTNTGVKIVIVVDMEGKPAPADLKNQNILGLRDSDLKPAFKALQSAYINLLRNPFYNPDDHAPAPGVKRSGPTHITSPRFIKEVQRIGEAWAPGVTSL